MRCAFCKRKLAGFCKTQAETKRTSFSTLGFALKTCDRLMPVLRIVVAFDELRAIEGRKLDYRIPAAFIFFLRMNIGIVVIINDRKPVFEQFRKIGATNGATDMKD